MKWIVIVSAALLTLAGCKSASKHDMQATAPAQKAAPVAAAATMDSGSKISCTKGKVTRILEIVKKDKGCGLNYTKYGKTSEIASSSHGTKHCQVSQDKVKGKLEKAGYKCGT